MQKKGIKNKAALSWTIADYRRMGDEPPECVFFGKTEGEILEDEALEQWLADEIQILSVIKNDNPQIFDDHYRYFVLDLEYLYTLGKITQDELESLIDIRNFSLGQK
jgi:predicted RNase H-like HicB family nuclease